MEALDDRKAAILRAIVQDYVRDGEPVGSKRLTDAWELGVSPATVRGEMSALEHDGYIVQPHTSAGRVPTDKGYRFFVDTLTAQTPEPQTPEPQTTEPQTPGLQTPGLLPEQAAAVEGLLMGASDLEDLLRRTSTVLSRLTRLAALVAVPALDRSRIRHIELVPLGGRMVMAVVIADTGRVEKRVIDLDQPVAEHDISRVRHAVNEAASGLRVSQAPEVILGVAAGAPAEARGLLEALAAAVRSGLADGPGGEHVFLGGTANIAGEGYFDRLEQVKQVVEALEEQVVALRVLRETLAVGDPGVRIGTELPLVELAACSIVAARYGAGGEAAGSLGVLGPMRMDYPRTLAAVQAVASSLEKSLAELTGG